MNKIFLATYRWCLFYMLIAFILHRAGSSVLIEMIHILRQFLVIYSVGKLWLWSVLTVPGFLLSSNFFSLCFSNRFEEMAKGKIPFVLVMQVILSLKDFSTSCPLKSCSFADRYMFCNHHEKSRFSFTITFQKYAVSTGSDQKYPLIWGPALIHLQSGGVWGGSTGYST